ncbi:hypothetical protein YC2023_066802 [Brassica napus]
MRHVSGLWVPPFKKIGSRDLSDRVKSKHMHGLILIKFISLSTECDMLPVIFWFSYISIKP